MADESQPAAEKSRLRSILMVALILVVEAAVIIGVMMVAGTPEEIDARLIEDAQISEDEKIVEMLVLDAKLPNNKSGITYIYNTEIFVQV